ncbi:hypothetical protein SAMN05444354_10593 [Stigmatella aurantiaca]|uniref:Uncharacterized protein n=1 Tax=Stigmatella aurantiaca TaxID=41 RepID=A0A1H7NXS8_STIAU|nr:hypothetical protein [Stigmatella aurantiaca]SEL27815.1 hypothetical protein SAMN05444354_10593 [Stigmatella aurantiaca]
MSTLLDAFCEDSEGLLDDHPELDARSVSAGSERIPRLLFVTQEADFFQGRWPHPFAALEERHQLADVLFGRLLDADEVILDAEGAARYLEQLILLLQTPPLEIPPTYLFSSPKGELFPEVRLGGSLRAQAGFDHCVRIDAAAKSAQDLRGQTSLDTASGTLRILQQSMASYCGNDFANLLKVAKTAQRYGRGFVLTIT